MMVTHRCGHVCDNLLDSEFEASIASKASCPACRAKEPASITIQVPGDIEFRLTAAHYRLAKEITTLLNLVDANRGKIPGEILRAAHGVSAMVGNLDGQMNWVRHAAGIANPPPPVTKSQLGPIGADPMFSHLKDA